MPKKILIMGLPGAGKTTLAKELISLIDAEWLNADQIRKESNDWDFSLEGRTRQAKRMRDKSDEILKKNKNVVVDFVCPTSKTRNEFNADFIIWVDTIEKSRFEDTNLIFESPKKFNLRVTSKNAEFWSKKAFSLIKEEKND